MHDDETPSPPLLSRLVTQEEIDLLKERAVQKINLELQHLAGTTVCCGDELRVVYRLNIGTTIDREEAQKLCCNYPHPHNGPPCHLKRGHDGEHCSVNRWDK